MAQTIFFEKIKEQMRMISKIQKVREALPGLPIQQVLEMVRAEIENEKENAQNNNSN